MKGRSEHQTSAVRHRQRWSEQPASWRCIAVGIGLSTCATLLFEIALTRIFSVILAYHYGFMVISLALLGVGLAGIFVYLYPDRFSRSDAPRSAAKASVAFAVSTVVALLAFHVLVSARTIWPLRTFELVFAFLMMTVPFFFAGLAIAIPLSRYPERIGPLYAIDLVGAALGAVLVIPLLALLGGHRTVIVAAILASVAAILFARAQRGRHPAPGAVIALVVCSVLLVLAGPTDLFQLRFTKRGAEHDVVFERWNSFSRVTVLESLDMQRGWNLSRKVSPPGGVRHKRIRIDGGAGTPMLGFTGDFAPLEFLRYDVSSLGYQVRPQRSVAIIGSGGGRDILTAKSLGVERVHAIEINPIIVDLVRNEFADFTQSPYDLPGVTFSVGDGRSFLATSQQRFDHVQISAVDTGVASAAGALALVEHSLYTTEAFLEYYDHLTEDGLLSITRPFNTERLEVTLRMVDLLRTAWLERGVDRPERHLIVIGRRGSGKGSDWGVMLASRRPFESEEVRHVLDLCKDLGFEVMFAPRARNNVEEIKAILGPDRDSFLSSYPSSVAATPDDRPFFFYFQKPTKAFQVVFSPTATAWPTSRIAPDLLTKLLLFVMALTFTTAFLVPMTLGRLKLKDARGSGASLLYFAGIGLGFILVEISLLQRYTLLLGQPIYAFAVILSSMLVFSGTGSLLSHRVGVDRLRAFSRFALLVILGGIAVHAVWMPALLNAAMRWDLPARLALTVGTIAPLALVMGIALPTGMRLMERSSASTLAWAWGVNGSLSVLGSVVAMCTSVFFGITTTLFLGLASYVLALVTPWKSAATSGAIDEPASDEDAGSALTVVS
jgi:predicted membrane-bound spermidine synthase